MAKAMRKQRAVRVLERAIVLAVQVANSSSSSTTNKAGKLAAQLEADLRVLKELVNGKDDRKFNLTLQRTTLKLVKLTRKLLR